MGRIKRLAKIFTIILIIVGGGNAAFGYSNNPQVINDAKVYIDGVQFQTKEAFYNLDGTTLVPMRALFEKLGAEVTWNQNTQTVVATTDGKTIELGINKNVALVNGKEQVLPIEASLIDGTTYIPLRFIAEALIYEVDWNNTHKVISIIDTKIIDQQKELKVYKSSSYLESDYIEIEIINNEKISVNGRTDLDKTDWLFNLESNTRKSNIIKEYKKIKSNNTYEGAFSLKNKLKDGDYKISIYFKDNSDSMYWSYYWDIPLRYENGEIFFPISPVYKNNYLKFKKNSVLDPKNYLSITINNEFERKQIEDLANEIIKDAKSNYDKLIKINDWIAQNIYYNWDGYLAGEHGRTDPYGTLEARKSVCQGYAELTNVMLRSIGIPSRLVSGHALGVSASGNYWDSVNHTDSNHAWNEAFVDGRWIILDTTWNSGNKYEDGIYKEGAMGYRYFDPNLEVFSYNHKIMNIHEE
ncbi:MAG: stalk domain-containing protein [Tissierellia bacterium]|nr:stalk domain-containing protein [Tissierellia bacterium]